MKTIKFLTVLSVFLLCVSVVSAALSVQVPSSFTLSLNETATITNYQNTKITLTAVDSASTMSYPPRTLDIARIHVVIEGSLDENLSVSEGGSVNVKSLKITATSISNSSITLAISLSTGSTYQTPAPCPMDAKMCPDGSSVGRTGPNCEFAACPGTSGSVGVTVGGGVTTSGGGVSGGNDIDGEVNVPPMGVVIPPNFIVPPNEVPISSDLVPGLAGGSEGASGGDDYYEVQTRSENRLLFWLPIHPVFTYSVNAETGAVIEVDKPWWNFLAW